MPTAVPCSAAETGTETGAGRTASTDKPDMSDMSGLYREMRHAGPAGGRRGPPGRQRAEPGPPLASSSARQARIATR